MKPSKHEEILFNYGISEYLYVKVPTDEAMTKFRWEKQAPEGFMNGLFGMSPQQVRPLSFQQKAAWFRHHIERRRISWMEGADFMRIERDNVLISSLVGSKKVNMFKEVKV